MNSQPTIGILAGMGPRSTAPFIDLVVTACQQQYGARDDIDFPKMLICSQPAPFYEDRPPDHVALEASILDGLQHLERADVDFLAIACNTAHVYFSKLAASISVPLLDMVELGVAAIPAATGRVALLAARPTIDSGIYQQGLRHRGFRLVDLDWQSDVDHLLGETRTTTDPLKLGGRLSSLIERARDAGADLAVVACLDLSAIPVAHPAVPVVDTSKCLAHEIVRQWLIRRRNTEPASVSSD